MAQGRKTGGRTKGTPNKRTLDVIERLESLDCDPIEGMAVIAMDTGAPIEVRARMFSELAQYVAPKRKAVEHSGVEGAHFEFSWMTPEAVRELSMPQLVDMVLGRIASGEVEPERVAPLMQHLRGQIAQRNGPL